LTSKKYWFSFKISVRWYFLGLLNRREVAIKLKVKSARTEVEKGSNIRCMCCFYKRRL